MNEGLKNPRFFLVNDMFNVNKLIFFLFVLFLNFSINANAQNNNFPSIHQNSFYYIEKINNFDYDKTPDLRGFKDQYSPYGVSGCYMGNPAERHRCDDVVDGFSIAFPGYTSFSEYKVYIPGGVTSFSLWGFLPQLANYASVAKFDSPPVKNALLPGEYEEIKSTQSENTAFDKLLRNEELVMVHSGSGAMSISGSGRFYANPTTQGRWLYVRILNGGAIYNLRAVYGVNFPLYKAWYDNAITTGLFGANGDPIEGYIPPVNPPPLAGIGLTSNQWEVGAGTAPQFTITAQPQNANLGVCTIQNDASPSGILSIGASSGSTAQVTIDPNKAAMLGNSHTFVIACSGKTQNFTVVKEVQPVDPVAKVIGIQPTTDDSGRITLTLQLKHTAAEVGSGNREVNYWVGGELPMAAIFPDSPGSVIFFLAGVGDQPGAYGWGLLPLDQDPNSVAFQRNHVLHTASKTLEVPLGLTREELLGLHVKVRLGYQVGNDGFKEMTLNWTPAP